MYSLSLQLLKCGTFGQINPTNLIKLINVEKQLTNSQSPQRGKACQIFISNTDIFLQLSTSRSLVLQSLLYKCIYDFNFASIFKDTKDGFF